MSLHPRRPFKPFRTQTSAAAAALAKESIARGRGRVNCNRLTTAESGRVLTTRSGWPSQVLTYPALNG